MTQADPTVTEGRRAALAGARALVIDDDAGVRRAMMRVLNALGVEVTAARNGREALEQDLARFDVLFVDLDMPILNGKEFKRELDRRKIGVPVVVVSGECDGASTAEAMGAVAFIPKPCSASALRRVLSDWATPARSADTREIPGRCSASASGSA